MLWSSTKSKPVDRWPRNDPWSSLCPPFAWTGLFRKGALHYMLAHPVKLLAKKDSKTLLRLLNLTFNSVCVSYRLLNLHKATEVALPSLQFPAKLDWPVRAFHALHRHRKKQKPHTGFRLFKRSCHSLSCPYLVHQPSPVNQSIQLWSRRKLFFNKSEFACRFLSV